MTHIPKIIIKAIDPTDHQYSTCGDYFYDKDENLLTIYVSRMEDWRSEFLVAIHEAFESLCLIDRNFPLMETNFFDMQFEREREEGKHGPEDEPGDDINSPYRAEHVAAEKVEKEAAAQLGISWEQHSENCNA